MGTKPNDELQVQTESDKLHGDPLDHAQTSERARPGTARKSGRGRERQPPAETSVEDRQDELENRTEN